MQEEVSYKGWINTSAVAKKERLSLLERIFYLIEVFRASFTQAAILFLFKEVKR